MLIYAEPKFTELLYFILSYLKHIKGMEPKSISGVTSLCSNSCTNTSGHSEGDMTYLCSLNRLPFLMKCNNKFLEKYKGSIILGYAYICNNNKNYTTFEYDIMYL